MGTVTSSAERRLALVWLGLVAITILSWWLGSKHGPDAFARNATITTGVILLALIKVRFIMGEFMELRHAPARLRTLGDAWLVLTGIALLGAYFVLGELPLQG